MSHFSDMDHHLLIQCQRHPVHRPKKKVNNVNIGGLRVGWTAQTLVPPSRVGHGLHGLVAPPSKTPTQASSIDGDEEDNGVKTGGISDSDQFAGRPQAHTGNVKPVRYYGDVEKTAASRYLIFCVLHLYMLYSRYAHLPRSLEI